MPSIKPRPTPPRGYTGLLPTLPVRHPHYRDFNTLLHLPALDEGNTIDYNVALVICGIISDNSWETGWFARASDGSSVCPPGVPLAASGGHVFYFVNDKSYKYPVCLSWDEWRLPDSVTGLPVHFRNLPIDDPPFEAGGEGGFMQDVKGRDKSCRLSGVIDGCDQAHLIPAKETEWWDFNIGASSNLQIESSLNGILLRVDLHRLFDVGAWVPMAMEGQHLVAYVVRTTGASNQFVELWHHTEMQNLIAVDQRCLFARVAWAVLSLHYRFLAVRRLASEPLLVRMKNGELKEIAPEVFNQFSRSRSRNPSSTKRPRLQGFEEDGGVIVAAELCWDDEADDVVDHELGNDKDGSQQCYDVDHDSALYQRGRKRFRT